MGFLTINTVFVGFFFFSFVKKLYWYKTPWLAYMSSEAT